MAQEVHQEGVLKQHSIWQNDHTPEPCAIVIFGATGVLCCVQRDAFRFGERPASGDKPATN